MADSGQDPWFVRAFDAGYLARYAHRDQAEAEATLDWLIGAGLLVADGPVLDLCCGAGRHGLALARRGFAVHGFDLSRDLLRHARDAALEAGHPVRLARGSMEALPYRHSTFANCIHMFTAFGYFARDENNRSVLHEVARTLRRGGRYVLDLFNGPLIVAQLVPESTTTRGTTTVRETRAFDTSTRRLEKTIEITHDDGRVERRFESVRVLDVDEGARWLHDAGFRDVRVFGDYAGAPYAVEASPRLVFIANRA